MKNALLLPVLSFFMASYGQSIQVTDMTATAVSGGISVNLKTISFNGAGYLSHDYVITGNAINLSVCYWFNATAPVLTFDNDFFIPVTTPGNYMVNVTVYNSASAEVCDYYSTGETVSTSVLSSAKYSKNTTAFYPNPTTGIVEISPATVPIQSISVFDLTGRKIKTFNGDLPIDLSQSGAGVYILEAFSDNRTFTQRIIKK